MGDSYLQLRVFQQSLELQPVMELKELKEASN